MNTYQVILTEDSEKLVNVFFAQEYSPEMEEEFNATSGGEKIIAYFPLKDSLQALAILALNSMSNEKDFGCKLEEFLTGMAQDIINLSRYHPL